MRFVQRRKSTRGTIATVLGLVLTVFDSTLAFLLPFFKLFADVLIDLISFVDFDKIGLTETSSTTVSSVIHML